MALNTFTCWANITNSHFQINFIRKPKRETLALQDNFYFNK